MSPREVLVQCVTISLAAVITGGRCEAQAPTSKAQPESAAVKTFESIEQLRQALREWRKELGPDGKLDAETAERLQSRLQELGRELQPILSTAQPPSPKATPAPPRVAMDQQQQWLKEVRALGAGAAERRAAAVAALRQALAGNDAAQQLAALQVLSQTGDVKFDRTGLRDLILPLVESTERGMAAAALYALYNTDRRPEDLALVQAAYARQPEGMAGSASHLLFSFADGKIEGRSEEIILELLGSPDRNTRREALRGLWGAEVTPKLASRIIELTDNAETRHDAIYFGLSTLKNKNEAVIDALLAALSDPDWNNWGRALWGLGHGVPEKHQRKVAAALVEMHNSRADARVRQDCARLVRQYGGEDMAARLE